MLGLTWLGLPEQPQVGGLLSLSILPPEQTGSGVFTQNWKTCNSSWDAGAAMMGCGVRHLVSACTGIFMDEFPSFPQAVSPSSEETVSRHPGSLVAPTAKPHRLLPRSHPGTSLCHSLGFPGSLVYPVLWWGPSSKRVPRKSRWEANVLSSCLTERCTSSGLTRNSVWPDLDFWVGNVCRYFTFVERPDHILIPHLALWFSFSPLGRELYFLYLKFHDELIHVL